MAQSWSCSQPPVYSDALLQIRSTELELLERFVCLVQFKCLF